MFQYTECPTTYQTRQFFNNSKTNEDIATIFEQEYVRCARNEKECVCSKIMSVCVCSKIIKELPGMVDSGTPPIIISAAMQLVLKFWCSADHCVHFQHQMAYCYVECTYIYKVLFYDQEFCIPKHCDVLQVRPRASASSDSIIAGKNIQPCLSLMIG